MQTTSTPNPEVRACYERLGVLLEEGDDVVVEEGPDVLQEAIQQPDFFEGVETRHAPPEEYTRKKVIGAPDEHVIRYMEWPPGYSLLPHEHHGRPCFEVLVDGLLSVVDLEAERVEEDIYSLSVLGTSVTNPGETAVVDPRENEIHSIYSPVRSRSLHVYPEDNPHAYGYVLVEDDREEDRYRRERFALDD
jgi:hypothetical protein